VAYEFSIEVDIAAPAARVWRALCDPDEVVRWESGVVAALDAPADYPMPGQRVRWRTGSRWPRILYDRPVEVVPLRKLRSLLSLGPWRYDETYVLVQIGDQCTLTVQVALTSVVPVAGGVAARLFAGPRARRDFAAALASIKAYCESG
jgi:hypothetical protein